jgi:hypothetical protein
LLIITKEYIYLHITNSQTQKINAMKTATFKFYEMTTNGLTYNIITLPILMIMSSGDIMVEMQGKPQGKCIAKENVISINNK